MLLTEPDATPLDIRFKLFGTYVRIHPLFWLMTILLGWNVTHRPILPPHNGMTELAIWVGCVFVSILLHEFGHVWMGQIFGTHGDIVLHSMGGLAIGASNLGWAWKRILVSAAGPGIQLVLWGVLILLIRQEVIQEPPLWVAYALSKLLYINFSWAILNLLPIWPLDGGQITRELCVLGSPRQGLVTSLWISLVVSAVLAANALVAEQSKSHRGFIPSDYAPTGWYIAILFALFAVGSWQVLQVERQSRGRVYEDDSLPWER